MKQTCCLSKIKKIGRVKMTHTFCLEKRRDKNSRRKIDADLFLRVRCEEKSRVMNDADRLICLPGVS